MSKSNKNSGNGLIILVIIILVLLIGAIAAFVVFGVLKNSQTTQEQQVEEVEPEDEQSARDKVLERGFVENEEQAATIMEDMGEKVAEGMFECCMSMDWYFPNSQEKSPNSYVENKSTNTYPFYFDVYVSDTREKVYSSPIVPVGSYIQGITLEKNLPAGVYDMEVVYTMVNEEKDYEEVSTVGFAIDVEIGS